MIALQRVAIYIDTAQQVARDTLAGVQAYAAQRPWELRPPWPPPTPLWDFRHVMPADGLIARPTRDEHVEAFVGLNIPTVIVTANEWRLTLPQVYWDNRLVGRLAADHLCELGLRSFATYGRDGHRIYSRERFAGFDQRLAEDGYTATALTPADRGMNWESLAALLLSRLQQLPRPCGVFADIDTAGIDVIECCHRGGLRVPEDIAIVGVGNDESYCTLARPPLSSVALPGRELGFLAGEMLDRLMAGQAVPQPTLLLPPTGVVARGSTDRLAFADPHVVAALRFIRGNGHRRFDVPEVLAHVPLSRRPLEVRFLRHVGHTLQKEIWLAHLRVARQLLQETDLAMPDVAERSGFLSAVQMSQVFRRELGMTPTQVRRQRPRVASPAPPRPHATDQPRPA